MWKTSAIVGLTGRSVGLFRLALRLSRCGGFCFGAQFLDLFAGCFGFAGGGFQAGVPGLNGDTQIRGFLGVALGFGAALGLCGEQLFHGAHSGGGGFVLGLPGGGQLGAQLGGAGLDLGKVGSLAGGGLLDLGETFPQLREFDGALQCLGSFTASQMAAVEAYRTTGKFPGLANDVLNIRNVGGGFTAARLAGWVEEQQDWGVDRVMSCMSILPGAGAILAGGHELDTIRQALRAFDTPSAFAAFMRSGSFNELFGGNAQAASFIRSIYDGISRGENMAAIVRDILGLAG